MSMRIVFMGTPEFAVPTLLNLVGQGHDVAAVYTRAERASGRGHQLQKTPVHRAAEKFNLAVETPASLRSQEAQSKIEAYAPDCIVVVAYGLILPPQILSIPSLGCINIHASLLPRWRGAAPIQRAIMTGDHETGIAIMKMEEGLDTGPVAMIEKIAIDPQATASDLHDKLAILGSDLIIRALSALERGTLNFIPQLTEGITYAEKISKEEARIDWNKDAKSLQAHIHGLSPSPGAWFEHKGERIKVLRAVCHDINGPPGSWITGQKFMIHCGQGALELLEVQRAGRARMSGAEALRGLPLDA